MIEIILMFTGNVAGITWYGHFLLRNPGKMEQRWGKHFIYGGAGLNILIGLFLLLI